MPRIRYTTAPRGVHLNSDVLFAPEGSLILARNVASLAGEGYVRSAAPVSATFTNMSRCRAFTKFNDRWITFGEVTDVVRFERQNTVGGDAWTLLDHTALTVPATVLNTDLTSPALFITAPPTPEKNEHLFMLDPGNARPSGVSDNALLKLNEAGTLSHWGILPPTAANVTGITSAAVAQSEKYIHSASSDAINDVADWTLASADESTLSATTAITNSTNPAIDGAAIKFKVGKGDSAQITRAYGGAIDLATGYSTEDFIQLYVRVRRPKHIHSMEIAFDTTSAADFKTTFFSREINFKLVGKKKRKKLIGLGDLIRKKDIKDVLSGQSTKTTDLTYTEEMGNQKIPVSQNTWTRITLPKNTFQESGAAGTPPSWATVYAIRITIHANKQGTTAVFLDRLTMNGGAGLYGDYEYTLTYSSEGADATFAGSRSNPPIDDADGTTTGVPYALITHKIANIERQGAALTLPAMTGANAFDPQVTRIEIWRTVGNSKVFFRCGYIAVSGGTFAGGVFNDTCADYYGLNASAAPVVSGNNTSFAVLDPNEELPLDNTSPNDPDLTFQTVANQTHAARMWWGRNIKSLGTEGLVYYSPIGRMEAVQGYVQVTSGATDPIQALVVWNSRLYAFTMSGLFEIVGTDEPFIAQKVEGVPGTLQPYTVSPSSIGIIWVAEDGVYVFNGQYAKNITDPSMMPLFRHRLGSFRSDISYVAATAANARAVAGKNAYYISYGMFNYGLIYDFDSETWRYGDGTGLPSENGGALYYDASTGKMYCDSNAGGTDLSELDARTYPTTGTVSFFTVGFLPHFRAPAGQQCILRKLWFDVMRGANGASTSWTPYLLIDNEAAEAITAFTPAGNSIRLIQEYNLNRAITTIGVYVTASNCRDCRINAIELDIYVPGDTDES